MSLPQREGRPKLDILPEDKLPETASWAEQYDESANPNNKPVPEGSLPERYFHTGWNPNRVGNNETFDSEYKPKKNKIGIE